MIQLHLSSFHRNRFIVLRGKLSVFVLTSLWEVDGKGVVHTYFVCPALCLHSYSVQWYKMEGFFPFWRNFRVKFTAEKRMEFPFFYQKEWISILAIFITKLLQYNKNVVILVPFGFLFRALSYSQQTDGHSS